MTTAESVESGCVYLNVVAKALPNLYVLWLLGNRRRVHVLIVGEPGMKADDSLNRNIWFTYTGFMSK